MSNLKHTTLYPWHVEHGAKTADFGGWDMPIEYVGVVAEHTAVREAVGVFDVSHMGKVQLRGPGVADWLNTVVASDLNGIAFGKAQYSMLLNANAGVIDDLIVYKLAEDEVWIVPNAANSDAVVARLRELLPLEISLTNLHLDFGIVAIQGPKSPEVLGSLGLPADLEYMSAVKTTYRNVEVLVCRSGYTGETGFEVLAPNSVLLELWSQCIAAGASPIGLGARDTLRLEMGYPLHGHELSESITPLEAGVSWAIGWDKPHFEGSDTLKAQKAAGAPRKRAGLLMKERGIPRADMNVVRDGQVIGITTSGTFSPTLKQGVALSLVTPDVKIGDVLHLDVRGRLLEVEVVKLPFVAPSTK
jgi:aminomethyltransferase